MYIYNLRTNMWTCRHAQLLADFLCDPEFAALGLRRQSHLGVVAGKIEASAIGPKSAEERRRFMNQPVKGNIIPGMRYFDAPAAIDWLCEAFGFSKHLVIADDQGGIAHAQLILGNGMIMLGSVRPPEEFDGLVKNPTEVGINTQAPYIYVEEIDEHYRRAREAGAEMVYDIADQDYGRRLYTARDPEGYLWSFGSYNPWA